MQLRDPFPEIKRIAGILIHEVMAKLSRNSNLKARLGARFLSGGKKSLNELPPNSDASLDRSDSSRALEVVPK